MLIILDDGNEELFKSVFDEQTPALTISDFRRHWSDSSLPEQKINIDRVWIKRGPGRRTADDRQCMSAVLTNKFPINVPPDCGRQI